MALALSPEGAQINVKIVPYVSPAGPDCSAPPVPTDHGFAEGVTYQVHGWYGEAGELRAVLVNDQGEIWGISNRHLRSADCAEGDLFHHAV